MNAPISQEKQINNQGEDYSISIKDTLTHVAILICKDNKIPRKRFENIFTIDDLIKASKWFLLFDSTEMIVSELLLLVKNNKIKLEEDSDKIHLTFLIKVWNIEEIKLDILLCEIKSTDIIDDICTSINQMNETLSTLVYNFEVLKENPEYIKMYNRGNNIKNHKIQLIDEDFLPIIKSQISNYDVQFKLIYASNIDEGTSDSFHKHCDNQSETLVVIKTDTNIVFGGYTSKSWDMSEQYKLDEKAFLFSNAYHIIYPISNKEKAIYCSKDYGPVFGSTDIITSVVFNSNQNSVCFSHYSDGTGNELNGNKGQFIIKNMEVYKKIIS